MPIIYNGTIPNANDQLSVSQPQIKANFAGLQNYLEIPNGGGAQGNHGPFNSNVPGEHVYIEMPDNTVQGFAIQAIGNNEMAQYANTYAAPKTNQTEIFIAKQNASTAPATARLVPMTAARFNANGYTYLPSGLLLKWGTVVVPTINLNTTVNFNTDPSIPIFAVAPYNVQVTIASLPAITNLSAMIGTVTATQFNIYCRAISAVVGSNVPVNWFAIGIGA